MIKYSGKEIQAILNGSKVVTSNIDVCNELRLQVVAESAKADEKRLSAYDALHTLYDAYQTAKAAFDNAVSYVLWQNDEFTKNANIALEFAVQNMAHQRGLSANFARWIADNDKLSAIEKETKDVSSVAKLASVIGDLVEDYQKAQEQANTQKAARRSKAERWAAKRAAAAAAMAEIKQLEAELEESK